MQQPQQPQQIKTDSFYFHAEEKELLRALVDKLFPLRPRSKGLVVSHALVKLAMDSGSPELQELAIKVKNLRSNLPLEG